MALHASVEDTGPHWHVWIRRERDAILLQTRSSRWVLWSRPALAQEKLSASGIPGVPYGSKADGLVPQISF